uniref:Uncharacterized protein n=1 Tax=Anguilla anguilla TaxID=7936 RepID=A0A0E9PST8_ANGAN
MGNIRPINSIQTPYLDIRIPLFGLIMKR